jgi:molybdopterin converting factor small subunit
VAVVFLPTPLRKYVGGATSVQVPGATLRQVIEALEVTYPGLREQLVDPELEGRVIRSLSAIVDGEPIDLGLRTTVDENSEIHFIPAIAGG